MLLIACANVANLLLTRASGRQKEVAIDPAVLAFTFGVSLLTGILFGLAPAFRAAGVDLTTALKAGGRSGQGDGGFGSGRLRLRSLLVVSELALALMLLIGAGLLIRSFMTLQAVSPGFKPESVISMRLGAGRRFDTPQASNAFFREVSERIANVPGVTAAGSVTALPFTSAVGWGSINVEGFQPRPGQELQVDIRSASPNYFRTMEIPVIRGRAFTLDDTIPDGAPVAIIDEPFARRFWPNGDAIGKTVWFDPKRRMTIVGVVGMVKQAGLDVDGRIVVYMLMGNVGGYQVARTASSEPASVAAAVARTSPARRATTVDPQVALRVD